MGNLIFRKTARNFNPECAKAGKICIAEVSACPCSLARSLGAAVPLSLVWWVALARGDEGQRDGQADRGKEGCCRAY